MILTVQMQVANPDSDASDLVEHSFDGFDHIQVTRMNPDLANRLKRDTDWLLYDHGNCSSVLLIQLWSGVEKVVHTLYAQGPAFLMNDEGKTVQRYDWDMAKPK